MGNFSMLPSDIVSEILSRLPTESALECKLVSKPWRNVVRHPSFSQRHLNHLNNFDSGKLSFIFWNEEPYSYTEYDESLNRFSRTSRINFIHPIKNSFILGSCNGLVCFFAWFKDHCSSDYICSPAYICNPITREYIVLPKVEVRYMFTGFGYVPSTNEYKVVSICNNSKGDNFGNVQVYTLGSGIGWRNVGSVEIKSRFVTQPGEFANGAIYWAWADSKDRTFLAFDLAAEEIRVIPSPQAGKPKKLLAVGNFLCANFGKNGGSVWVLKKNENTQDVTWSKEFSHINLDPITLTQSGGLLGYNLRDKNVYRYSSKASPSTVLVNFGKNFRHGVPHKNTLVSLKALGEESTGLMDSGERGGSGRKT